MTNDTPWTSIPRANKSVVIKILDEPVLNSFKMTLRDSESRSPCVADTVKSLERNWSVSQSTFFLVLQKNHSLSDIERIVKIAQRIQFPLFPLAIDEKLSYSFQRDLLLFDQNSQRIVHEICRNL